MVTFGSAPRSSDVRLEHPTKNDSGISVRFDSGPRFNDVNPVHLFKNE